MKYILPGMGASSNMYSGPWRDIKDSCFIDWPPYNNEVSIADLAKRLITEYPIDRNDTLIGSSLGGMIALEIAHSTGSKRIFLIGSAVHSDELSILSKVLMPFAGKTVVRISQYFSSWSNDKIQQMYSKSEPDFIVSMSKAILNWQGFNGNPKIINRIHGKQDHFITCPENCEIIEKGGHLIALTHARECVDFINRH